MKVVKTACPLDCWDSCSMIATVDEDGKIIRIDGDPDHPITLGVVCGKGKKLVDRLYHTKRFLKPLKKISGVFQEISWDQAFDEIAGHMLEIREKYGPTAVLHHYDYGSGTLLKALEARFFNLFGGYTDTVGSLCWEAGLVAHTYDFGYSACHSPQDMAEHSGQIVIWGRNVPVTNMHMMPFIKQAMARGVPVIVINPSPTDLDRIATDRIQPRPGTDGVLALGVCKLLLDWNSIDETFIQERSVGFAEFYEYVQSFSLEKVAEITSIDTEKIIQLAKVYASPLPTCTLLGIGLQRYSNGGNSIRAIDALVAISGNIGIPGGGVNYANRGISKFFDWDEFTATDRRVAYREFTKITQADEILAATDPPVQMLFVTRSNPITQLPNAGKTIQAYERIPVKVVVDMFMTETAKYADYILPCLHVFEEEDVLFSTMWNPYMTYINPVVERIGEAKSDLEIWQGLAQRLGFSDGMEGSAKDWIDRAFQKLKQYGITREELQKKGVLRFPVPDVPWSEEEFATPSGKFEFYSSLAVEHGKDPLPVYHENREERLKYQYPYHLLTVHPRKSLNSQNFLLNGGLSHPEIEISEMIAHAQGLKSGERVYVWNERGSIEGIVKVSPRLQDQTIRIEQGFVTEDGQSVNILTPNYRADLGIASAQYDCRVNIRKVGMDEAK